MKRACALLYALSMVLVAPAARAQAPAPSHPLTLQEAVALALKNNPAVHAADAYAEAVREAIDVAKSGRYPKLNFSEGFTRGNNPVYVFGSLLTQRQFAARNFDLGSLNVPPPLDNFRTQFTASLPVYDAGDIRRSIRNARLDSASAERGAERTGQQVIFRVISAYFGELLARENVRVAEAAVGMATADLARAQARERQGLTVPSDVLSAQVQLAQMKEELIQAQNGLALAQPELNVALGLPEDAPTEIEGGLPQTRFESGTLAGRQQRALAQRPDYLQASLAKDEAANGLASARSAFLPRVGLFSSWEEDNQTFATRGGNNWAAGVNLTFNIFNGGADWARIREARARERQAEDLREQMAAEIRLEVRQAYLNLTAARERMEVTRDSAAQAKESLRILRNRYETSLATMTDLLRAEAAETRAERDHLSAEYDYRIAYAALELATGDIAPGSPAVAQPLKP